MASTSSIGGLVSGLDTSSIISSLMQIEAQPQTLMKTRLTTEQSTVSSLQGLNAKFAALSTKASALASSTAWSNFTTSSSSSSVTAAAGSDAIAGSLSFTVQQTATAHQLSFTTTAAKTDVVTSGSTHATLTTHDGTPVDIDTGDGTLSGLVKGLNASSAGVTADLLKLDDGTYRLKMVSDTTGAASDFTLTNTDGSALLGGATVSAGRDAKITVDGDTVSSSTNTFTGITSGLDVTLADGTPTGTAATVTVARNPSAAQASLQGLVDAANDLLASIDTLTAYDSSTQKSGALSGDATVRALRSAVLDTVTKAADGSSMASVGVQTDRYGKITFDTAKFASAYATDPTMVATKLGAASTTSVPGFAARLADMADKASNTTDGTLTSAITGHQSSITTLQSGIADWDVRLADRQEALNKQYAALEVSLGKLQDQASWLSGQISSLSGSSSSS